MAREIQDQKRQLKAAREERQEIIESHVEYAELEEAKAILQDKQRLLREALIGDDDYNTISERIADATLDIADNEEILSQHLILYRDQEHRQAIEIGKIERPIIIKAKLGKEQPVQTKLDITIEK